MKWLISHTFTKLIYILLFISHNTICGKMVKMVLQSLFSTYFSFIIIIIPQKNHMYVSLLCALKLNVKTRGDIFVVGRDYLYYI